MMATSKHLIKQQDELFIGVCRRSPYMQQGFPWYRFIFRFFRLQPREHWSRAVRTDACRVSYARPTNTGESM